MNRKQARFGRKNDRGWGNKPLSVSEAVQRVRAELYSLGIRDDDSIISTNIPLRLDGYPRSDQRAPSDPGAAVYWSKAGHSTKVMAIDTYDRVEDNLAAIAATLGAMRAIERHGGAKILERAFTGFVALPSPQSPWEILGVRPGSSRDDINAAFRTKAANAHPDHGGDHSRMAALNAARDAAIKEIST
jgi:hypothetical protein